MSEQKPIEKIREATEAVRKGHEAFGKNTTREYCAECSKGPVWVLFPCPTLRLAEDRLKLALFVERVAESSRVFGGEAEKLLSEVAGGGK